jgi:hypothetical protein
MDINILYLIISVSVIIGVGFIFEIIFYRSTFNKKGGKKYIKI